MLFILFSFLLSGPTFAGDNAAPGAWGSKMSEIKMPCNADNSSSNGLRPCSTVQAEVINNVQQRIQQQANGYYNGVILNAYPIPGNANYLGASFPQGVCNYFGDQFNGTFNNGATKEVTHSNWAAASAGAAAPTGGTTPVQTSCGAPTSFQAHTSGHTCQITPQLSSGPSQEDAYTKGLIINSLNCSWAQIKSDLQANKLSISGVNGQVGVCGQLAKKYSKQSSTWNDSFKQTMSSQANINDINNCNQQGGGTSTDPLNPDVGRLRQSACQLQTARTDLESNFEYLAFCEVMTRSENSYETFLTQNSNGSGGTFYDKVRNVINQAKIQGSSSDCNSNHIYNIYWNQYYLPNLEKQANAIWNSSVCQ
jgi:hypothetical protein